MYRSAIRINSRAHSFFLIYINDIINSSSKFHFTIYADDTHLLLEDKDINTLQLNFTSKLDLVNQSIKANKLKLNVAKTTYLQF